MSHPISRTRHLARRPLLATALGLAATLMLGTPGAQAQSASAAADAPLRLVVGYPPGGSSDRVARIVALPAPTERQATQWYFQRYVEHLPAAGEIRLFDRSWYNRAGVEKVMGYCTDEQYQRFLQQAPVFERGITDDGILLFKYWLCVDQAQQEERFAERADEPLKSWKLSPIDLKAREKYADYTAAREAMLKATHTANAPWTLVDFNDQRVGRLTMIRDLLDRLPDTRVPVEPLGLPPLRGKLHKERYGVLKPIKPQRGG